MREFSYFSALHCNEKIDLQARDISGLTPLMKAVISGSSECAELIYDKLPHTLDDMDEFGQSALHFAVIYSRLDIIKVCAFYRTYSVLLKNQLVF